MSAKGTLVRNGVKEKASGRGVRAGPRAGRPAQHHLAHVPPLETEHQARRESTQHAFQSGNGFPPLGFQCLHVALEHCAFPSDVPTQAGLPLRQTQASKTPGSFVTVAN